MTKKPERKNLSKSSCTSQDTRWSGYNDCYDIWEKYHKEDIKNNYIHKSKLTSKAEIIEIIIDELKKYKEDEKFKFNAKMSGKIWTTANWLAKALSKKISSKK